MRAKGIQSKYLNILLKVLIWQGGFYEN